MFDDGSDTEAAKRVKVSDRLQDFWRNRDWPVDRRGHIFLGRAVDLLGTARFGESWVALNDPTLPEAFEQRGIIFEELTCP